MLGIEAALGFAQQGPHARAARNARPAEIDAVEQVPLGALAQPVLEGVLPRAAALGGAEALALVHAPALARDLGVGAPEQRVVGAEVGAQARARSVRAGAP